MFMAAFNEIDEKMDGERHKKETKSEWHDLMTSHPPWPMISDGSERHIFYSITQNRYYVRFVPTLQNKVVYCCYGGLLVLRDKSTDDLSIFNILSMETFQLPPLNLPLNTDCVISSPNMDGGCRVIFFERALHKFFSCHLGDSEFIERDLMHIERQMIRTFINFKGKLYALTGHYWNLFASDFSDPELQYEQVISGESLEDFIFNGYEMNFHLLESCEDLLLIFMGSYDNVVCDVKIFKADFSIGEWVKLETLGDRAIFLGSYDNNFSYPVTTAVGMKGNAVYWDTQRRLYMYDIEDKSISISLSFPVAGTDSSLCWVSFPMTFNEEKKLEQKYWSSLFEASPTETTFSTICIEEKKAEHNNRTSLYEFPPTETQSKSQKREETDTMVSKESLWADLHSDLLLEIFPHLFAGDSVAFRSVCRSWYSLSPSRTTQQFVLTLNSSYCSAPLLMCPDNKAYNPIHGELYSMDFPHILGAKVRAVRDGWLLMDYYSKELFFYNPITKAMIVLPDCNAIFIYSVYFSEPPTSADHLVVIAAMMSDCTFAICFKKCEDEAWTCHEISPHSFCFSHCNIVVHKGLYHYLGYDAELLILNPHENDFRVIEAPKFISDLKDEGGQQYMLESDGKLIAVFVGDHGSLVYTCEWNDCTNKWEIIGSLGNIMLFVSRPLSLSKKATVSGTGNKIYFPRVVGDEGQILFYSLATKRYHTFEMGTSYSNFSTSKFYPEYNGWFML